MFSPPSRPLWAWKLVSKESQRFCGHDDVFFIPKGRILRPVEAFENLYALKREGISYVDEESVFAHVITPSGHNAF